MRLPTLHPRLLILALTLLLGACGTNPYSLPTVESGKPTYEEPGSAPEQEPQKSAESSTPSSTSAHSGLIARADDARNRGDYDQALAYLERAQRIDPDDAEIYLGLAQTHAAAGNNHQAQATAERGLLYCSGSSQCNALRAYTR